MLKTDLIILGTGSAGLSAGIYAKRYEINHIILGRIPGGTMMEAHKVANYPGFNDKRGYEIAQNFMNHYGELGGNIINENIIEIKKNNNNFIVITDKNKYESKSIIYALGGKHRNLNVKGEKEFFGKGVSYCATCDGPFYKDKIVAVVGGGDAALTACILLSNIAKKIYIIYRGASFSKGEIAWVNKALAIENLTPIYNTNVIEIKGDNSIKKIIIDNKFKNKNEIDVDGLFIEIGSVPNSDLAKNVGIHIDERGYIEVNDKMQTNIKGFFAAGDVSNGSGGFMQIITGSSEGAIATYFAKKYLGS